MRSELAKNTLQNLCRTLSILASSERQAVYEREVPFVDVPAELLAQWSQYASLLDEQSWFSDLFDVQQRRTLDAVSLSLQPFFKNVDQPPDLREIHTDPRWRNTQIVAQRAIDALADLFERDDLA